MHLFYENVTQILLWKFSATRPFEGFHKGIDIPEKKTEKCLNFHSSHHLKFQKKVTLAHYLHFSLKLG